MSVEHNSRLWVCTRCGRRKGIELEPDPVLLKVCDECKIQNWCRNPKGAGLVITEVLKEAPPTTIIAEDIEVVGDVVIESVLEDVTPEPSEKEKEIEALKAQLAELETNE